MRIALAQESPEPAESPSTGDTDQTGIVSEPSASPLLTATPAPSASPIPTSVPTRSVKISFLPPPLEGTISLGIYDKSNQLVRVLHQEADVDEFTIGADALVTKWDGKNDKGEDLPAGTYRARGYAVGSLKVEAQPDSAPPDAATGNSARIKLVANPLANDTRSVLEVTAAFDGESCFLKTADGLPLFTLADKPNITRVFLKKGAEKTVEAWVDDGVTTQHLRISNVDKMMAFDCGDLQLK